MAIKYFCKKQAQELAQRIRDREGNLRELVYVFHVNNCFDLLGYSNLQVAVELSLKMSLSRFYRTLGAIEVEKNINPGGKIGEINESVLRELNKIKSPLQQRKIWRQANKRLVPGRRFPTAKTINQLAQQMLINTQNNQWSR
jgi:hypothetical protein